MLGLPGERPGVLESESKSRPSLGQTQRELQSAAGTLGLQLHVLRASDEREINTVRALVAVRSVPRPACPTRGAASRPFSS
jgi:hypothetical protein